MAQPSLFDDELPVLVQTPAGGTIQERFLAFHQANPWVFTALEKLVGEYVEKGRRRVEIRMFWEVIRWQFSQKTTGPTSEFRTNDHFHSRYVRLLIDRHPEWAGVFELRRLKAK